MKKSNIHFLLGFTFLWFMDAFTQDFIGLDRYIEYIKKNWSDEIWTLWLSAAVLTIIIHIHLMSRDLNND